MGSAKPSCVQATFVFFLKHKSGQASHSQGAGVCFLHQVCQQGKEISPFTAFTRVCIYLTLWQPERREACASLETPCFWRWEHWVLSFMGSLLPTTHGSPEAPSLTVSDGQSPSHGYTPFMVRLPWPSSCSCLSCLLWSSYTGLLTQFPKIKHQETSVDEDVERLEPLYIAGRNVKWYSCYRIQYGGPQEVRQNHHMTQQFHSWVYSQKNWKQGFKHVCKPMFIAALFTVAKR